MFEDAFAFTIKQEGGFVLSTLNHDSGGQTYAGIARIKQPQWSGWAMIDAGDTTSIALQNAVGQFYLDRFWLRPGFDKLPSRLALLAFDFSVNSGDGRAAIELQKIVGTVPDGKIGANTLTAISVRDEKNLAMLYLLARLDYLDSLDAWQYFSRGWSARVVAIGRAVAQ